MPTYEVIITRDVTESTVVTVEASDERSAGHIAILRSIDSKDWEVDDNTAKEPYVTDVTEVPEYKVTFADVLDKYAVIHTPSGIITDGRFDDRDNAQMWADHLNAKVRYEEGVKSQIQAILGDW